MRTALASDLNFLEPDYQPVVADRLRRLDAMRQDTQLLIAAHTHYAKAGAQGCVDFINDWIWSYDPRNVTRGVPASFPLILFPRQEEYIHFLYDCYANEHHGLVEKSRDSGATVLAMAFAIWLWMYRKGSKIGVGSRKEMLVDRDGDPDSIFEKLRMMLARLPREMLPVGYAPKKHSKHMQIANPANDSVISGEAGDNIGRGGRNLIYIKDESAFYERADKIEAALSQNTRIQIDISTPNGPNNAFARKRHAGNIPVFTFHWRDDPRKSETWYAKQQADFPAFIVAQEIDINYNASLENQVIPGEWVEAAVNLAISDDGPKRAGLDVADEGVDANALAYVKGPVVKAVKAWRKGTTTDTARKAYMLCVAAGIRQLKYDSIGVGAGVKGELKSLRETKKARNEEFLLDSVIGINVGSKKLPGFFAAGKKNKDMFANIKARDWWLMRQRFEKSYKFRKGIAEFPHDELISIPNDRQLIAELSQIQYGLNDIGQVKIVSKKESSAPSPNKAEAVQIAFSEPSRIAIA